MKRSSAATTKPAKKKKLPPGVRERDGRFTYRYSTEVVENGKKRRKQKETESYKTAQEAREAGILIKASQLQGKYKDPQSVTLLDFSETWVTEDYQIEREPRVGTIKARRSAINSLIKFFGGNAKLNSIDTPDYQRYLNSLKSNGKKKLTLVSYHSAAMLMFDSAVRKKIITVNPAKEVHMPVFKPAFKEKSTHAPELELPKYLEKDELKLFLKTAKEAEGYEQEYRIFTTLAFTGLRVGELFALSELDYRDLQEGVGEINVTKTLEQGSVRKFSLGPPKTTASYRIVSVRKTVMAVLQEQFAYREKIRNERTLHHEGDFLFWSTRYPGFPYSSTSLINHFEDLLDLAGLPTHFTPHSLRHTHASLLAEAGESLEVIQQRLGHENDDITKRIYLHVTKGRRTAVSDKFEQHMAV